MLTLLAGTLNLGSAPGALTAARFYTPTGLNFDASGNLYVVDNGSFVVHAISSSGSVTTLAGSHQNFFGSYVDGTGTAAQFTTPFSAVWNASLNALIVTDAGSATLRQITTTGVVTIFAGQQGTPGSQNGNSGTATFNYPSGIAVDSSGNMYVADANNNMIREVSNTGAVSTLAGSGAVGANNATGSSATFSFPTGVVVDSTSTDLYVADQSNCLIRKIVIATGVVTTFAGTAGTCTAVNGTGGSATFNYPSGIGIDSSNNLYVADSGNNLIRMITTPGAVVTTFAGSGASGHADGTGAAATFNQPGAIASDGLGNLYVADTANNTIRKIVISSKAVTTYAGTAGPYGGVNGTGTAAQFELAYGLTADTSGNIYVADTANAVIRKITSAGVVTTLAGSMQNPGFANGTGAAAKFSNPQGIVYDSVSGALFVADASNYRIRKVTTAGVVTTYAGSATSGSTNSTTLTSATFQPPGAMTVDSSGNLYLADTYNCGIRKIATTGVTTFAGILGSCGLTNGASASAQFSFPRGVAVDSSNNVYVADTGNSIIRKISGGTVTTFAGTANTTGFVDGTGTAAKFNFPTGLIADSSGNLYVSDTGNNAIRKITPAGVVTTVIGNGSGITTAAELPAAIDFPTDVALYSGKLYISIIGGIVFSNAP